MKNSLTHAAIAALVLGSAIVFGAQHDQNAFAGRWNLNVQRSQFEPGEALKAETDVVIPGGTTTIEGISPSGKTFKHSYPFSDGKPVPFNERKDITVTEVITGNTVSRTMMLQGKVVSRQHGVLSEDSRTVTLTIDSTDPKGRASHEVYFYDRQ